MPLKPLIGLLDGHELAGDAGEDLGDVEGLRQEALDLARARHDQLVLFGQLVHAENGDDVLQRLVALQHLLDRAGDLVVLLADDAGLEDARGRVERIDGRVDAELGDRARLSTVVASRWAKEVAGAGSVRSSAGT